MTHPPCRAACTLAGYLVWWRGASAHSLTPTGAHTLSLSHTHTHTDWSVSQKDRGSLPLESYALDHSLLLWGHTDSGAENIAFYWEHYVRDTTGFPPTPLNGVNSTAGQPGSLDLKHWSSGCADDFSDSFADCKDVDTPFSGNPTSRCLHKSSLQTYRLVHAFRRARAHTHARAHAHAHTPLSPAQTVAGSTCG